MHELQIGYWGFLGLALAVPSLVTSVLFHFHTDGKSSPFAALAFVVCGPVLAVLISIPYALKEASRNGLHVDGRAPGAEDVLPFALFMIGIGLLASAITAAIVEYVYRDYV